MICKDGLSVVIRFLKKILFSFLISISGGYTVVFIAAINQGIPANKGITTLLLFFIHPYVFITVLFYSLFAVIPIHIIRVLVYQCSWFHYSKIKVLISFLLSSLCWFSIAYFDLKGIPIKNSREYKKYFTQIEIENSKTKVNNIVRNYKNKNNLSSSEIKKILINEIGSDIAKHGMPIVPYIAFLASQQKIHLLSIGHGINMFRIEKPYNNYYCQVLSSVRDKKAITYFKKIIADKLPGYNQISLVALETLFAMETTTFTKSELMILFKSSVIRDKYWHRLIKNITTLSPMDYDEILINYLNPGFINSSVSLENGTYNVHYIYDKIDRIKEVVQLLGNTNSKDVCEYLEFQSKGFRKKIKAENDIKSKQNSNRSSDTGKKRAHKEVEICKELLKEYEKSIANIHKNQLK